MLPLLKPAALPKDNQLRKRPVVYCVDSKFEKVALAARNLEGKKLVRMSQVSGSESGSIDT
jgi:hypothetical protein